jgi:hypothetical protein
MSRLLLDYVNSGAEPWPDQTYGDGYRCSAYLKDGTYLPCVMLRKSAPLVALAMRRIEEEKKGKGIFRSSNGYQELIRSFVACGNRVNGYDIDRVEPSRFAIPFSLVKQVQGETTMGWTGFVLEMRDGKLLPFGTTFLAEFFNIPAKNSFEDAVAVHSHSYVSASGELRPLPQGMSELPADYNRSRVNRERPYFTCHIDTQFGDA